MNVLRSADEIAEDICSQVVAWTRSPTRTAKRVRLGDIWSPDGKRFQITVEEVKSK